MSFYHILGYFSYNLLSRQIFYGWIKWSFLKSEPPPPPPPQFLTRQKARVQACSCEKTTFFNRVITFLTFIFPDFSLTSP